MGGSNSDAYWQEEMENAEMAIIQSIEGLDLAKLTISYT